MRLRSSRASRLQRLEGRAAGAASREARNARKRATCSASMLGSTDRIGGGASFFLAKGVDARRPCALALLDLPLRRVGGVLDLPLEEALLDRGDGAAERVDLRRSARGRGPGSPPSRPRRGCEPPSGSATSATPRLVRDHLLRPQGQPRGLLRRQGEGLVLRVGVQRLRPAEHRGERLQGDAHDVDVGLLRRQRRARRLRVEAQLPGARVLRAEAVARDLGPERARRAELGDLLEEVRVRVEEEGQPRREVVDREARARAPPRRRRSRWTA